MDKIKCEKVASWLIIIEVCYSLLMGGIVNLGVPQAIRLLTDFLLLLLALVFFVLQKYKEIHKKSILIFSPILIFGLYAMMTALINGTSFVDVLAATRNWFHGLVFIILCAFLTKKETVDKVFSCLKTLYVLNFIFVIPQFLYFRETLPDFFGDYVTGIVTDYGAMNILVCVVLMKMFIDIFDRGKIMMLDLFYIFSAMIVAALVEIKLLYFEYLFMVVGFLIVFFIMKKLELKNTISIIIVSALALFFGLFLLYLIYPKHFFFISSIDSYKHYVEASRAAFAISRTHPFSEMNTLFFHDNIWLNMFGFGFGKTFEISTTFFYSCHIKLIFEGGLVGFLLYSLIYLTFFIAIIRQYWKNKKLSKNEILALALTGFSLLVLCYDSSLYKEAVYPIAFGLGCGLNEIIKDC